MAVSPSGSVFVSGQDLLPGTGTIDGQTRVGGLFEIDAVGTVTPFQLQVTTTQASVAAFTGGTMVINSTPAYVGGVNRQSVAAFDLTTGALLPFALTLQEASGAVPIVRELVAHDDTVHLRGEFSTVNGQARLRFASVNSATSTLLPAWSVPDLLVSAVGPHAGGWLYLTVFSRTSSAVSEALRRLNPATGIMDPTWTPATQRVQQAIMDGGDLVFLAATPPSGTIHHGVLVAVVDQATAQVRELFRSTATEPGKMIIDGDTVYVHNRDLATYYGGFDFGSTVRAFDRTTGVPVSRPALTGRLTSVALVDGRFVVGGRNVTAGGVDRYGLVEVTRAGAFTAWDGGFAPHGPPVLPFGAPGGATKVAAHGDVLVAAGAFGPDFWRVAVFDLSTTSRPTALRSRTAGGVVEFSWVAPATAPPGGYVIEGGFTPGQVAASLPVGTGTTFATQVSVIGPAFVRVRPQGSTEVSNEIVVGCLAPPLPPTALTTAMNGTNLTLAWTAPLDPVTTYLFSAGTVSGRSDAATTALPGRLTSVSGTVPAGTFFVRVQATNACGTSGPSGEVFMTIGAPDPLPAAPTNVAASVSGSTVTLTWTAPPGPVTGYVLEGGTALGLANIGAIQVGAVTSFAIPGAPSGVYAVRVRAITSAGSGAASTDVVVVVP